MIFWDENGISTSNNGSDDDDRSVLMWPLLARYAHFAGLRGAYPTTIVR